MFPGGRNDFHFMGKVIYLRFVSVTPGSDGKGGPTNCQARRRNIWAFKRLITHPGILLHALWGKANLQPPIVDGQLASIGWGDKGFRI
jgi:hypothetical protein